MRNNRGFTLVEMLLYISLAGILIVVLISMFTLSLNARLKNQSMSEVNQQGIAAIEYMTNTLRNATAYTSPAAGASANSLTATVPTASLSPTIFSLNGTILQVKEGAAAAIPLTNSNVQITALSFKNLSRTSTPGVVQINLTVSKTNPSSRNEFDYQKTFTTSVAL